MNKSDYDKYYQKGGSYVIPVELFNELFDELEDYKLRKDKAIEYLEKNTEIRKATFYGLPDYEVFNGYTKDVLEILKGNDN